MTEPEQQAIAQLKQGDPAGLTGLVKLYQVRAVHAALLIVRDQGVAEQIVQDAFLQAYRKIEQFDERRPFGPWFLRSVIHAALKTTAREARFEPLEEPDGDGAARSAGGSAAWWMDPDFSPPERAEQAELRKALEEFVAFKGPAFLEVVTDKHAFVYPMVGPGLPYKDMLTGPFIEGREHTHPSELLDTSDSI